MILLLCCIINCVMLCVSYWNRYYLLLNMVIFWKLFSVKMKLFVLVVECWMIVFLNGINWYLYCIIWYVLLLICGWVFLVMLVIRNLLFGCCVFIFMLVKYSWGVWFLLCYCWLFVVMVCWKLLLDRWVMVLLCRVCN